MQVRLLSLLVSGACAIHGQAALAQTVLPTIEVTDQASTPGTYEVTSSKSATKADIPLRDVPQIVNVVPAVVMREQNAASFQDALQNVTGLSFSVGDGQRDQVAIRGFTAISDQFVDGVRDDALYFRDLSNVERLEVLKGPASVLYGRGSAGGIVNRVTKRPQAAPIRQAGIAFSSEGQRRGEFDLGAASASKDLLVRLTGAVEDSTGFRDQYFLERTALAPSATIRLAPRTTLTMQFDYLKDKRLADQGVPSYLGRPVDVPVNTYYGAANGRDRAFVQSEVASATVTFDHAFSDTLKLHTVFRDYDYALDRNYTTISRVTTGAVPTVTIAQTRRLRDEDGSYLQTELSQDLRWGAARHQLLYGVELGRQDKAERLSSLNNAATYNLFRPVLANLAPLPASIVPSAFNDNQVNIAGVYLQDLMTVTPQWKVLAGVRYDRLEQTRDDRTARNMDLARVDHTTSPRAGLVYQPSEQLSLYAAYSKSFQPVSDAFVFRTNSDRLKPTQTVNREIGAKFDVGGKASFTAALFDMGQTNIQVADPANLNFALPVGEQRTRGLELAYTGELAPGLDLMAGYAFMDGVIEESTERTSAGTPFKGNTAALTPRHSASFWLKHKIGEKYYVAAGGRAEGARFAAPDNLTRLPGYGVLHLGAGYTGDKVDVTLTLKNLAGRKYYVAAHSGANDYNMPGEPRTLQASARYRF